MEVLRYLVCLLMSPNVDTLFVLLKFLHSVAQHANDTYDQEGELVRNNSFTLLIGLSFNQIVNVCNTSSAHIFTDDFLQKEQGNKMDARNLATIFAPSILRADHGKLEASLAENESQITAVETLIQHYDTVFRVRNDYLI